jgi:vancomycin resistance protein YoaR
MFAWQGQRRFPALPFLAFPGADAQPRSSIATGKGSQNNLREDEVLARIAASIHVAKRVSAAALALALGVGVAGCQLPGRLASQPTAKPGVTVEGESVGRMRREQVGRVVDKLAKELNEPARLPRLDPKTGRAFPGTSGRRLNQADTVRRVMQANDNSAVKASVSDVTPSLDAYDLTADPATVDHLKVVSHFATPILDPRPSRLHNLIVASSRLTGVQIKPGATFSFNRVVGADPKPEDGYLPAPVIDDNGRKVPDYGGGLCQVSTTVYNAALAARLPIVERHPHSKPVRYAPNGRDATVYTDKDLKFRNSRRYPLYLLVRTEKTATRAYIVRSTRD